MGAFGSQAPALEPQPRAQDPTNPAPTKPTHPPVRDILRPIPKRQPRARRQRRDIRELLPVEVLARLLPHAAGGARGLPLLPHRRRHLAEHALKKVAAGADHLLVGAAEEAAGPRAVLRVAGGLDNDGGGLILEDPRADVRLALEVLDAKDADGGGGGGGGGCGGGKGQHKVRLRRGGLHAGADGGAREAGLPPPLPMRSATGLLVLVVLLLLLLLWRAVLLRPL